MRTLICVFFLAFMMFQSVQSADFAKIETIFDDEKVWENPADSFMPEENKTLLKWLSDKKDGLRYPAYSNSPAMTFLGNKCWETIIRFTDGKLDKVEISLYNRGDAGDIQDEKKFIAMLGEFDEQIEKWAGEKGTVLPKMRLGNGMKLEKKAWVKNNLMAIELKWSGSENIKVENQKGDKEKIKYRAEYIQVIISKFDPKNDPRKVLSTSSPKGPDAASAKDIKQNVKKDEDGFTYIENIPMVDQGQKGYCAVATSERILRYYGIEVDQHLIAQVANSSSEGGTNPEAMLDMLKKLGVKFGVKVKIHNEFNFSKFQSMVGDYNKVAKKAKEKTITLPNMVNIPEIYQQMDPAILKEAKCEKDKGGFKNFQSDIIKHVDLGIPLPWGIMVNLIPEKIEIPPGITGHMRIISGYNKEKNEIIYSDSWGAGHERKTMSFDDAWTITTGLYSFDPRK